MNQISLISVAESYSNTTATMSSREIAALTKREHSNIKISAERLAERGVIGTLATQEFSHNGNTYTEYLFGKRDSLVLVAQNCPEFTAALVDRWEALETGKAQPKMAQQAMHADPAARGILLAGMIADVMNLHGSARLGVVHNAMKLTAPEYLPIVPSYAVDSPSGSTDAAGSEATHSLTELLKRNGVAGTASQWNRRLEGAGILEQMTRPSSKGVAKYWSITKDGLPFGKNVTNPKNQLETQPHWYDGKFLELIERAGRSF